MVQPIAFAANAARVLAQLFTQPRAAPAILKRVKSSRFFSLFALLFLTTFGAFARAAAPADASTRADASAEIAALFPPPPRLEGALQVTYSGVTTRGTLKFEAPDNLRIDIARDEAARIEAQTVVARGEDAKTFSTATERVREIGFNAARQPWRGTFLSAGGPANLFLFGWSPNAAREYSLTFSAATSKSKKSASTSTLPAGARLLTMTAKPEIGRRLQTDFTRSGGDNLLGLYAAYQRDAYDRPARIALAIDANGTPLFRENYDADDRLLTRTEFKVDAKTRLPLSAVTRDAKGRLIESWKYDLKTPDAAFDAATFELPESARVQVIEDASTRAISAFNKAAKTDADAQYNLGVALWERAEDVPGALSAWGAAASTKPRATAPHFAIFAGALSTRNFALAAQALEKLATLRGADDAAVAGRRINLLIAQRDFDGAAKALDAAQQSAPQDLRLSQSRADIARGLGEYSRAETLLKSIVNSPNPQAETQVDAARSLANVLAFDRETKDDDALKTDAKSTVWLRLARAHFSLLRNANATVDAKSLESEPLALASLASGFERAGRADDAVALWQKLADSAFYVAGAGGANALNVTARQHLMALYAARGQASLSIGIARDLMDDFAEENLRRRVPDALLTAWGKAGKTVELGAALKQRAAGSAASENDLRLWLAYQEDNAGSKDVMATIRIGGQRFPKSAWWPSRLAAALSDQAASLSVSKFDAASKLFDDALAASTRATKLDPAQPYYASQSALIQTQKTLATRKAPVIAPSAAGEARDAAAKLHDALTTAFPNDSAVALTVATAKNALTARGDADANIAVFSALQNSPATDDGIGSDRHATVFFARQAAAMMMRQQGDIAGAVAQYTQLLQAPRNAEEQSNIALSYAQALLKDADGDAVKTRDASAAIAQLLARLAGEAWPLEDAQNAQQILMASLVTRGLNVSKIDSSPILQVAATLSAASDSSSTLASAQLSFALLDTARALNAVAEPPAAAERLLRAAEKSATDAEAALQKIADGKNDGNPTSRVLAARALVLLGERAGARGDWKTAITRLAAASHLQPGSVELRVTLARAYSGDGRNVEARRVRDDVLRAFDPAPRILQRAAVISTFCGDFDNGLSLAQNALDSGQAAPATTVNQQAQSQLALADAQFNSGGDGAGRAAQTWKFLSSEEWPYLVRVAALLAAQSHLQSAGRGTEADEMQKQLAVLQPTNGDFAAASDLVSGAR